MKHRIRARNPLRDLVEFAEEKGVSAIFSNTQNGKTVYYFTMPGYNFDNDFENKIIRLQERIFPENNTMILCTPKSREDPIWAKSVRVYWHVKEKRTNEPAQI